MLPTNKNAALVEYVEKKYRLDEHAGLKIVNEQPVEGSCYRRLTFEGKSAVRSWQLSLYLSPDGRFLTSELFDTAVDPAIEERKTEQALMAGLTPNTGSSRGSITAPVTIVEFSDFECPFCRKFAAILDQLSPAERDQVRIVFHHFPLPMHPWARAAAEGAACAQLQSSDAFWSMHDRLFENQQSITPENVKEKLREFAQASNAIDFPKFESCLENQMSLGLVFRDMNLAFNKSYRCHANVVHQRTSSLWRPRCRATAAIDQRSGKRGANGGSLQSRANAVAAVKLANEARQSISSGSCDREQDYETDGAPFHLTDGAFRPQHWSQPTADDKRRYLELRSSGTIHQA